VTETLLFSETKLKYPFGGFYNIQPTLVLSLYLRLNTTINKKSREL